MVEPLTLTAATIVTLFFSETVKEGGKSFGVGVSKAVSQLVTTVRNKFKTAGTEGVLARAEEQPSDANVKCVQAELVAQMEEDTGYTATLKDLLTQLESAGVVRQVMASQIEVAGNLEAKDMHQASTHGSAINQDMLRDVKAQNISLGNLTQEA